MSNITEKEILFNEHDLIVSITNLKGAITYVNDVFCKIAGFSREELIGNPHNMVRHKDMPKVIFKLLWETIASGKPISAYVKNKTKDGNYYWVKAYVAPVATDGTIRHYTSYRRPVSEFAKQEISKIYSVLLEYEKSHTLDESFEFFLQYLKDRNLSYEQFMDRLSTEKSVSDTETLKIDIDGYYVDHVIFKTNIVRGISLGKKDLKVVEPCCCNFGKKLKSLESMEFTNHPSWGRMHQHHNHVHSLMKEYVERSYDGATKDELIRILHDVDRDTDKLIGALRNVVDTYIE